MSRNAARDRRRGGRGSETERARQRLRPSVLVLEGRTLLSTWTVDKNADDGSVGTLRWAGGQANSSTGPDTIAFSSLFNTPQTITLIRGQIELTDMATVTITGPGATLLTVHPVSGLGNRVFEVQGGSASLSSLTVTGGKADVGG